MELCSDFQANQFDPSRCCNCLRASKNHYPAPVLGKPSIGVASLPFNGGSGVQYADAKFRDPNPSADSTEIESPVPEKFPHKTGRVFGYVRDRSSETERFGPNAPSSDLAISAPLQAREPEVKSLRARRNASGKGREERKRSLPTYLHGLDGNAPTKVGIVAPLKITVEAVQKGSSHIPKYPTFASVPDQTLRSKSDQNASTASQSSRPPTQSIPTPNAVGSQELPPPAPPGSSDYQMTSRRPTLFPQGTAAHHHESDGRFEKKGWLLLWHASSKDWSKHWFVLSGTSLTYYRNIQSEEAGLVDGVIGLGSCTHVKDYQVEKNFGFRIYTNEGAVQLAALTSNIRAGWIDVIGELIRRKEDAAVSPSNRLSPNSRQRRLHRRDPSPDQPRKPDRSPGMLEHNGTDSLPSRQPHARRGGVATADRTNLNNDPMLGQCAQPIAPSGAVGDRMPPSYEAHVKRHGNTADRRDATHTPPRTPPIGRSLTPSPRNSPASSPGGRTRHRPTRPGPVFDFESLPPPPPPRNRAGSHSSDTPGAVPLAKLDSVSTTLQMSSEDAAAAGGGGEHSRLNVNYNPVAELANNQHLSERRPCRLTPREDELHKLRQLNRQLTQSNADLKDQLAQLRDSSVISAPAGGREHSACKQQIQNLIIQKDELNHKLDQLTQSRSQHLSEIADLQSQLEETQASSRRKWHKDAAADDGGMLHSMEGKASQFEEMVGSLERQVEHLNSELDSGKGLIHRLQKQLEEAEKDLADSMKECRHMKEGQQKNLSVISDLKKELAHARRGGASPRSGNCEDESHSQLSAKLVAAEESHQILQHTYHTEQKMQTKALNSAEAEIKRLKLENESLKEKHKSASKKDDEVAELQRKLAEKEEEASLIEKKAAIEKLKMKQLIKESKESESKFLRESTRNEIKLKDMQTQKESLVEEVEALKKSNQQLESFLESRMRTQYAKEDSGVQCALPSERDLKLEKEVQSLKEELSDEISFFKRLGKEVIDFSNVEDLEVNQRLREKLLQLKHARDSTRKQEKDFLQHHVPERQIQQLVASAGDCARLVTECSLLRQEMMCRTKGDRASRSRALTPSGKFTTDQLDRQIAMIECGAGNTEGRLPPLSAKNISKLQGLLDKISASRQKTPSESVLEALHWCEVDIGRIMGDLEEERRAWCEVLGECSQSLALADTLLAEMVHSVDDSKRALAELAHHIDRHVQTKQKYMTVTEAVTSTVTSLELALDAIANQSTSSGLPRLKHTLLSVNESLSSLFTMEDVTCSSEHSTPGSGAPAAAQSDPVTHLCVRMLSEVVPGKTDALLAAVPAGSDLVLATCHVIVAQATVSTLDNVAWAKMNGWLSELESGLDRRIDCLFQLTESLAKTQSSRSPKTDAHLVEFAERMNTVVETYRLRQCQCMSSIFDKLASKPECEENLETLSRLVASSSDLKRAERYQKWLNIEIDDSLLRLEAYTHQMLLRKVNRASESGDQVQLGRALKLVSEWCESNPDDDPEIFLDPAVERNLVNCNYSCQSTPPDSRDRMDDSASLINYIILKTFLCSSGRKPGSDPVDSGAFQVTLMPPLCSVDATSFSSLLLTAAISLNHFQCLLSKLSSHFPDELKTLRNHIKASAASSTDLSHRQDSAEKLLGILTTKEITSTLEKIEAQYTKQFKRQREKYVTAVSNLQAVYQSRQSEPGELKTKPSTGPIAQSKVQSSQRIVTEGEVSPSDLQQQLRNDLMQTLESVNCYSAYISKLLQPDSEPPLPVNPIDPFADSHHVYIAQKLANLESRWSQMKNNVASNITAKTTACCEELFQGAFDIGLLMLFAHRVGISFSEDEFIARFSDEVQIIKELYDEAVARTVARSDAIIGKYSQVCSGEIARLKHVFSTVIDSDDHVQQLEQRRVQSASAIQAALAQLPDRLDRAYQLRALFEEQSDLVKEELQCLSNNLTAKSLEISHLNHSIEQLSVQPSSATHRSIDAPRNASSKPTSSSKPHTSKQ